MGRGGGFPRPGCRQGCFLPRLREDLPLSSAGSAAVLASLCLHTPRPSPGLCLCLNLPLSGPSHVGRRTTPNTSPSRILSFLKACFQVRSYPRCWTGEQGQTFGDRSQPVTRVYRHVGSVFVLFPIKPGDARACVLASLLALNCRHCTVGADGASAPRFPRGARPHQPRPPAFGNSAAFSSQEAGCLAGASAPPSVGAAGALLGPLTQPGVFIFN